MACLYKLLVLSLLLSQNSILLAQTEFEGSIPTELVKIFMTDLFSGEVFLYSDIPTDFPIFTVPENYEVLGGFKNDSTSLVVLRTELNEEEAANTIIDAFVNNNWLEVGPPQLGTIPTGGFFGIGAVNFPRRLCHDEFGSLSVPVEIFDGEIIVKASLNLNSGGPRPSCREQLAISSNSIPVNQRSGVMEYMPRLEVPENSGNAGRFPFMAGGGSGSRGGAEANVSIRIDWSIEEVYAHFENQLLAQDWVIDSQTSGELTAVSGWTKSIEGDVELTGFLIISKIDDSDFNLSFSLSSR